MYGETKLAGERAVRNASGSHLIVRASWVYAVKGKNFLRTVTRLAQERIELRIVADQVGAPTSAALIADALVRILDGDPHVISQRFAAASGLLHLAASGATSWYGFAVAIVEGLRNRGVQLAAERVIPIRTEDYPTRATRPHNSRLKLSRLDRAFGIRAPAWNAVLAPELDRLASELPGTPR